MKLKILVCFKNQTPALFLYSKCDFLRFWSKRLWQSKLLKVWCQLSFLLILNVRGRFSLVWKEVWNIRLLKELERMIVSLLLHLPQLISGKFLLRSACMPWFLRRKKSCCVSKTPCFCKFPGCCSESRVAQSLSEFIATKNQFCSTCISLSMDCVSCVVFSAFVFLEWTLEIQNQNHRSSCLPRRKVF